LSQLEASYMLSTSGMGKNCRTVTAGWIASLHSAEMLSGQPTVKSFVWCSEFTGSLDPNWLCKFGYCSALFQPRMLRLGLCTFAPAA
jgi:hypothetical protein